MVQAMAWATPFSETTSRTDVRGLFSNSLHISFRTVELTRGRLFSPLRAWVSFDWYGWYHSRSIYIAGGLFSHFFSNILCTVFPYPSAIQNTHWASFVSVYPFRDIFAFCRRCKPKRARTKISILHILFLARCLSVWKMVSELIE